MAHGLLTQGSLPRLMRYEVDKIWTCVNLHRRNKTNFGEIRKPKKENIVDMRKTKKRMHLPVENKEQYKLYKHLVHDYKPIPYTNKDKLQEELPQILNKKVKGTRDLGTQSREIDPTVKEAAYSMENKNINTFSETYSQSNVAYLMALANLVHDYSHENTRAEYKFCRRNQNLSTQITNVDVSEPQSILSEKKKIQSKPRVTTESSKSQSKMSNIQEAYGINVNNSTLNFSALDCNKEGFSLYEDSDREQRLRHGVFEATLNKDVLVNTLGVGDVKPQVKTENYQDTVKMRTFSTYDSDKGRISFYKDECQIETMPRDVTKQRTDDALVNSGVQTRQYSNLDTVEEEFSLYEDISQIEYLPPDALGESSKQSPCLKDCTSLKAMVESIRQRNRSEYFAKCMQTLAVTVANKPTNFPPLGPPPIMFPQVANTPPALPNYSKKSKKKGNKK